MTSAPGLTDSLGEYGRTHKLSHWHDLQDAFGFASPEPECTCSGCIQASEARAAQGAR